MRIPFDWQECFPNKYLVRGWDYFQSSLVSDVYTKVNAIKSIVHGTEDYKVFLSFDKEGFTEMSCSCPCAAEHRKCKHMAATLYKITGDQIDPACIEEYESYYDEYVFREDESSFYEGYDEGYDTGYDAGYDAGYAKCLLDVKDYLPKEIYSQMIKK